MYAARDQVRNTRVWREPREGVAWVHVQGVLDRPLRIAACYIPPQLPAARLDAIYARLATDVLDARTSGYVIVAGDVMAGQGQPAKPLQLG